MIFWTLLICCIVSIVFFVKQRVIEFSLKCRPKYEQDIVEYLYYDFNNKLHREDGPAIEYKKDQQVGYPSPEGHYYIRGKEITKEEFLKIRLKKRLAKSQKLSLPKLVIGLYKKLRKLKKNARQAIRPRQLDDLYW